MPSNHGKCTLKQWNQFNQSINQSRTLPKPLIRSIKQSIDRVQQKQIEIYQLEMAYCTLIWRSPRLQLLFWWIGLNEFNFRTLRYLQLSRRYLWCWGGLNFGSLIGFCAFHRISLWPRNVKGLREFSWACIRLILVWRTISHRSLRQGHALLCPLREMVLHWRGRHDQVLWISLSSSERLLLNKTQKITEVVCWEKSLSGTESEGLHLFSWETNRRNSCVK